MAEYTINFRYNTTKTVDAESFREAVEKVKAELRRAELGDANLEGANL